MSYPLQGKDGRVMYDRSQATCMAGGSRLERPWLLDGTIVACKLELVNPFKWRIMIHGD